MACNENVIKNMANEITRNCHSQNVIVEPEFVIYMIELLLLNPKYGTLFQKTINRNNLEFFVNECVALLSRGDTSVKTLKMQFIMQTNYDKLQRLIDRHLDSIEKCLRPLVNEILDAEPDVEDQNEMKKLFRKISIYIILASGLGNPGVIATLKEGVAALESVFTLNELKVLTSLPRTEKFSQLNELLEIVSGVRLFNRDAKRGGEGIPDLPFDLVDAGKASLAALSNSLIAVMQRVNTLTTAIEDTVTVQDETGNVIIDLPPNSAVTEKDYNRILELLAFNRQYEIYIRRLLGDVEVMLQNGTEYVEKVKAVLEDLHATVKYKAAVPCDRVFPLFTRLWRIWRAMQNVMYLISTVNRLMSTLAGLQEQTKIPYDILNKLLKGRAIMTDQERLAERASVEERLSLGSLANHVSYNENILLSDRYGMDRHIQYLGFCALCLCAGALQPCNMRIGLIKAKGNRYGFCSVKMAARFSRDPHRYINEVLDHARNNPHLINLLNLFNDVDKVKEVESLVTKYFPKTKVLNKDVQTEIHPLEEYIEKDYSWDLWEYKRRACKWATIVNCQTHSTQTNYSHLRSESQCQTVEPRDKCLQTKKDAGVNTASNDTFIWGLRGQLGYGQHKMNLSEQHSPEKLKAQTITTCQWPCVAPGSPPHVPTISSGRLAKFVGRVSEEYSENEEDWD